MHSWLIRVWVRQDWSVYILATQRRHWELIQCWDIVQKIEQRADSIAKVRSIVYHISVSGITGSVIYTGCPRRKGQNFRRVFLMLKYTDITQNTYIQSWTVMEIMAREECGLLAGLCTVPCQLIAFHMSVLDCRVRLQKYRWHSYVSTPLWLTMHVMYSAWNP